MHGKGGFSGFPGHKALPWFGLSFISGHSLMPLISSCYDFSQTAFGVHRKRGFSRSPGHVVLHWFSLIFGLILGVKTCETHR